MQAIDSNCNWMREVKTQVGKEKGCKEGKVNYTESHENRNKA